MAHLLETLGGFRAHALRGAVVADQFGKAFFDFVVAQAQRVIFGVGDGRRVVLVIALVVRRDLLGEARQLALRFLLAQLVRRLCPSKLAHARARFFGVFCAWASRTRRRAAARASSVTAAPDSIRAISSTRSSGESWSTRVASFPA